MNEVFPRPDSTEVISWLLANGSKINEIFHSEPSLVEKFKVDPDSVFEEVKKILKI